MAPRVPLLFIGTTATVLVAWLLVLVGLRARTPCSGSLRPVSFSADEIARLAPLPYTPVVLEERTWNRSGFGADTDETRGRYRLGPFVLAYSSSSYHGRPGAEPVVLDEPTSCDGASVRIDTTIYFLPRMSELWGDESRGEYVLASKQAGVSTPHPNGVRRVPPTRWRSLPRYTGELFVALFAAFAIVCGAVFSGMRPAARIGIFASATIVAAVAIVAIVT